MYLLVVGGDDVAQRGVASGCDRMPYGAFLLRSAAGLVPYKFKIERLLFNSIDQFNDPSNQEGISLPWLAKEKDFEVLQPTFFFNGSK